MLRHVEPEDRFDISRGRQQPPIGGLTLQSSTNGPLVFSTRPVIYFETDSSLERAYQERKNARDAILPPFEVSRASMHFAARARMHNDHEFCWTKLAVSERQTAYQRLYDNVHGKDALAQHRYRMDPYMKIADFEKWRKCTRCHKNRKQTKGSKRCAYHLDATTVRKGKEWVYICCNQSHPCKVVSCHEWEPMSPVFEDLYASFIETTPSNSGREAVVIDCEMVGLSDGHSELARLCVVDYLTGRVLIDCFVDPADKDVIDYRKRYSGITPKSLAKARSEGNCLPNWAAARHALLRFVDAETIIVGATLHHDLEVLRLVHTNVVDSAILSQRKVGKGCNRSWGLKTLCAELLNLKIQTGKNGHDPLEDCMATREIVLSMTYANEAKFAEWAEIKQKEEEKLEMERRKQIEEKRKNKEMEENTKWP